MARLRCVSSPFQYDPPARVQESRRPVTRELARGRADQGRVDAGFAGGPFGRVGLDLGGELVEAMTVLLDECPVVTAFRDEYVHPREQQREVGAGPDRQPVLRLARGDGEARVDNDDGDAPLDRAGEFLHLRVVHVLAQVRSDQDQTIGVLDVGRLGRAQAGAEGQHESDIARAAALRVRRTGEIDRTPALQHVLEEALANPVRDGGDRFRAVLRLDLLHPVGDVDEGLVPRHRCPFLLAALPAADQRLLQAIRIVMRADGAGAARAQPAAALRILRVAFELPQLAVANVGDSTAAPETHVAVRGDRRDTLGRSVGGTRDAGKRRELCRSGGSGERRGGDLEEASAGQVFHGRVFPGARPVTPRPIVSAAWSGSSGVSLVAPLDCSATSAQCDSSHKERGALHILCASASFCVAVQRFRP